MKIGDRVSSPKGEGEIVWISGEVGNTHERLYQMDDGRFHLRHELAPLNPPAWRRATIRHFVRYQDGILEGKEMYHKDEDVEIWIKEG